LKDKVQGEENSTFKNVLGEEITVEIFDDVEQTAALLEKVILIFNFQKERKIQFFSSSKGS
jgi:hypothetical protein